MFRPLHGGAHMIVPSTRICASANLERIKTFFVLLDQKDRPSDRAVISQTKLMLIQETAYAPGRRVNRALPYIVRVRSSATHPPR